MGRGRRLSSGLGGYIDAAVLTALRYRYTRPARTGPGDAEIFATTGSEHDRRAALLSIIEHYERPAVRVAFFAEPPYPDASAERHGQVDDGEVVDLAWPSDYRPTWGAAEYLAWVPNCGVKVRTFLHPKPARTAIVLLHGYRGGSWFVEERGFQARWLYSLGADVAMITLPFHGGRGGRGAPSWPSPDPARTNEGFGQAIWDIRALVRWLRGRPGAEAQRIAVIGMSLGGYTASLLATTDPLDFMAAMMPVAAWSELIWSHSEGREERLRAERDGISLELLKRAMAIVSPLERAPMVGPDQVLVLSAYGDRIAPPEHAERLAKQFGGAHLRLEGGHILQLGRRETFVAIAQRMALLGLIDPKPR